MPRDMVMVVEDILAFLRWQLITTGYIVKPCYNTSTQGSTLWVGYDAKAIGHNVDHVGIS